MIGNQEPRIRIEPPCVASDGRGAAMLMAGYGVQLDQWQELVLSSWLGHDEAGNYTALSAGLSVPRQNGKNTIIEAREFYGLVVNGERILHTAHQQRTAKRSFRRLVAMFTDKRHPEIIQLVKQIRYGIGEESIELHNGGIIEFCSRSRQAARGYEGISLVVYDEAQELTDDQAEAIMATLSASTTGIRQLIYIGTPIYPGCTGTVFKRFREACINGSEATTAAWHEWSIDAARVSDLDASNREYWYKCNPAMGVRLTEKFTEEELKTLSLDGFARERLGWWAQPTEISIDRAIDTEAWNACASDQPKPEGKTAFGVKFAWDGSTVVLAGACIGPDGIARITIIAAEPTGRGLQWLADWLNQRYGTAACVVVDGNNGADILIEKIKPVWIHRDSVIKPRSTDMTTAAALLINELAERRVTWYRQQEDLRLSALSAVKRKIGNGWGFGGENAGLIEACSLALWGVRTSKRDPRKKMRIG